MPTRSIYLDHNATTPPHPEVLETVRRISVDAFANPGSQHSGGRIARRVLEESREVIAEILGAFPDEVVFTSGGTEANNLAIRGLTAGRIGQFAVLPGEHPSLEEPLARLEALGWERNELPMSVDGLLDEEVQPYNLRLEECRLLAMVLAHNETGAVRRLDSLYRKGPPEYREHHERFPIHLDAVQAAGRIPVNFHKTPAATMSIAAHKFRGPRGIGALLVRRGLRLPALFSGGHQEASMRPGTECPALAAGMAKALQLWSNECEELMQHMTQNRDRLESGIRSQVSNAVVNGGDAERLPNTSNIAFPGCDGEALLVALDLAGVCASLGSACASGSAEPSPILIAMGLPDAIVKSSVRFSVGWTNTAEEIEDAVGRIVACVERVRGRGQSSVGTGK